MSTRQPSEAGGTGNQRGTGFPARPSARSASTRRLLYGLSAGAIVAFALIWTALANLIALDPRLRVVADVTATGEHRLAPRTRAVLDSLEPGYEVAIAGAASADRQVRTRVADVLDAMARTGRVQVTWIDDPAGQEYTDLLERLVARDRPALDGASQSLGEAADELERGAALLDRLDEGLRDTQAAIVAAADANTPANAAARQRLAEYAGVARALASDTRTAAGAIRTDLGAAGGLNVPPIDTATMVARRVLARLASELQTLSTALGDMAAVPDIADAASTRARTWSEQARIGRAPIAIAGERADAIRTPDIVRVARVLEGVQAVLVVSPTGVTAVAFDTLFPSAIPETVDGARADIGAQAEDLITSALASLASPRAPIVVVVHAEDLRLLEQNAMTALVARLALRRIDVLEWRIVAEPEAPSLTALDPTATRPVVYVALGTSSASGSSGPSGLSGADRVARLGTTLRRLADRGEPILLSIAPSTLPAFGAADEATTFLSQFGLAADSGRPLLTERILNGRRFVDTDRVVQSVASRAPTPSAGSDASGGGATTTESIASNPIAAAAANLAIALRWGVALERRDPPQGVRATVTPLIEEAAAQTWGEAQWLAYWQVPAEQRARVLQPPTPDANLGDDTSGPWLLAAAVERTAPFLARPQRLVVVGANGWFFDAIAARSEVVGGRVVPTFPGNSELFEASVYWLAGQEDFIARSAAAGSVATIRPLSPGEASVIRWLVLAILPLGTLGVGIVWRLARG
ncbi:MAG: hypothetical protein KDA05_07720 [Phycisphaerales bacterium]|nr:hypothetical protein [Phycisphaerales bacterium]